VTHHSRAHCRVPPPPLLLLPLLLLLLLILISLSVGAPCRRPACVCVCVWSIVQLPACACTPARQPARRARLRILVVLSSFVEPGTDAA